jgi:xanthine dehydrogenase accessory factor
MSRWLTSLREIRRNNVPAIMVSVDSIIGSTPREPGAKMIVTSDNLIGTIGGGNLEFQACRIARDQLQSGKGERLRRFPLGAGLGQCCGGLVNLMFEPLQYSSDWAKAEAEAEALNLILFGAGHVGQACVRAMQDLPVRIQWIDSRDELFPPISAIPENVEICSTDVPEAEIDDAASGSCFLVMTHEHNLDQRLAEQILQRDDFVYFGLIGSTSKRRMFETRMKQRGVDPARFNRMTCPIGIDGIDSKQPALIAISVAAEIAQVYDQLGKNIIIDNEMPATLGGTQ